MNQTNEKQTLLIAVHRLSVGGVQKALISALGALDYDRYDVTLYVRQNKCELLGQVDPRVSRIVVNNDPTRYYRKPRAILYWFLLKLFGLLKKDPAPVREKLDRFVIEGRMRYEKKRYFSDGTTYDLAISYIQSHTARFVAECVPARRKIMFFHGSTDENHALHERIFPAFDRITAVNKACRDILRELYPAFAEKIGFIENYIDADLIRSQAERMQPDRAGKTLVLCSCGRFSEEKGFDLAVECARLLKERGTDFLWYFAGDGPMRGQLEQKRALYGLENNIRITGMTDNPYPYIAGCDIYVQPSREESFGLTVGEALILCRPVVTTATVGGKNLVRDGVTGLVSDISASALAENITALSDDASLRKQMETTLRGADRSGEKEAFRRAWKELLEKQ